MEAYHWNETSQSLLRFSGYYIQRGSGFDSSLQALEELLYHGQEKLYDQLQKNWPWIGGLGCSRVIRSSNEKNVSQTSFEEQICKNSWQTN